MACRGTIRPDAGDTSSLSPGRCGEVACFDRDIGGLNVTGGAPVTCNEGLRDGSNAYIRGEVCNASLEIDGLCRGIASRFDMKAGGIAAADCSKLRSASIWCKISLCNACAVSGQSALPGAQHVGYVPFLWIL